MSVSARKTVSPSPTAAKRRRPAQAAGRPVTPAVKSPAPEPASVSRDIKKKPGAGKAKRVRGTFVMPEPDYALIAALKMTGKRAGLKVKKSELFRLGLRALKSLSAGELQDLVLGLRLADKRK